MGVENQNLGKTYQELQQRVQTLLSIEDQTEEHTNYSLKFTSYREKRKAYANQGKMLMKMNQAAEEMVLNLKEGKMKEEEKEKQSQQLLTLN